MLVCVSTFIGKINTTFELSMKKSFITSGPVPNLLTLKIDVAFAKSLDPDQEQLDVGLDLDLNHLTL